MADRMSKYEITIECHGKRGKPPNLVMRRGTCRKNRIKESFRTRKTWSKPKSKLCRFINAKPQKLAITSAMRMATRCSNSSLTNTISNRIPVLNTSRRKLKNATSNNCHQTETLRADTLMILTTSRKLSYQRTRKLTPLRSMSKRWMPLPKESEKLKICTSSVMMTCNHSTNKVQIKQHKWCHNPIKILSKLTLKP